MQTKISRVMDHLLPGAAAALAAAAAPVAAQSVDRPADPPADAVMITVIGVAKQAADVQTTPVAISAFSGAQLENQGVREVKEVARFTPGFTIRDSGNSPSSFALAIRGQVQTDNIATLEPSVGVYLDEMYIARAYGLNTNLLDVKSAQILKGPQGTLFGRNTSAGAVLFQTNDPEFDRISALAEGRYGRFEERAGTGVVNLGFNDRVALRGAVYYERRNDYQRDVRTGRGYGDRETLNGRVKVAFKPADNVTLLLSGEWFHGQTDGPARQNLYYNIQGTGFDPGAPDRALFGGDPDKVAVTQASQTAGIPASLIETDMKTETYMAKLAVDIGFGEVKWINGYRRIEGYSPVDLDGSSQTIGNHISVAIQDLKQWSTELQMTGKLIDDRLSFALGFTYLRETGVDDSRTTTNGSPAWAAFSGDLDNKSIGIYGQANYKLTDRFGITGGIRWSNDQKGVTTRSAVYPGNGSVPAACLPTSFTGDNNHDGILTGADCDRYRRDSWSNVSYTIGADYNISDDVMVYAKQSRGYRAGAEQLRSLTLNDNAPANPEIVNEQEVGIKTSLLDKRVRFNLAGYHNTVKGAQRSVILVVSGVQQTILENADTKNWGFEGELSATVADGLDLFAGYAYTNPKYTKYDGYVVANNVLTPFDKREYAFVTIVKNQFMVGGTFSRDLGPVRLEANANYAWQDKMMQIAEPLSVLIRPAAQGGNGIGSTASAQALLDAGTTKSYGITNASIGLAFGPQRNYELTLWGRNVFDVRAKQYVLYLGGLNYVASSWNDPATYGVTARVKW